MPAILLITVSAAPLTAQKCEPNDEQCRKAEELRDYIKAKYTKYEYMAPMRDGVRLFVSVYAPKGNSKPYPIWMQRTPYTVEPYGVDNYRDSLGPSEYFVREGYIFAYCDVRGRGKSEGTFEHVRPYIPDKTAKNQIDEASDAYDTIEFLLKAIPNNRRPGGHLRHILFRLLTPPWPVSGHPALKAVSPQAPVTEWFLGDASTSRSPAWPRPSSGTISTAAAGCAICRRGSLHRRYHGGRRYDAN